MSFILVGLLFAQAKLLPEVDRRALDAAARAEATVARPTPLPRRAAAAPVRHTHVTASAATRLAQLRPTQGQSAQLPRPRVTPAVRNASDAGELDLSAITTICRAAGNQPDPAAFLATLSRAYTMSADRSASLRTSCAAYLAGRADAGATGF